MTADETGRIRDQALSRGTYRMDQALGDVGFRIRTAVSGTVLAIALFLATTAPWFSDRTASSFGEGPGVYGHWNLWAILAGSRGGYGIDYAPIDTAERGPAEQVAVFLVAAVLLTLVTAVEAHWGWAFATGVAGILTFVFEVVLLNVGLGDHGHYPGPDFYKTGAGLTIAMWATGVLAVWALALAVIAWRRRDASTPLPPPGSARRETSNRDSGHR